MVWTLRPKVPKGMITNMSDEFLTYTTTQASTVFGVSGETIRTWAGEFDDYLSPTARPGEGKTRLFTTEDMGVFALVKQFKTMGKTFKDCHVALGSGQRGEPPSLPPEELSAVVAGETEKRYILQIEHLRGQLEQATAELVHMREIRDENIQLRTKIDMLEQQLSEAKERGMEVDTLREQLGELRGELKAVLRELDRNRTEK